MRKLIALSVHQEMNDGLGLQRPVSLVAQKHLVGQANLGGKVYNLLWLKVERPDMMGIPEKEQKGPHASEASADSYLTFTCNRTLGAGTHEEYVLVSSAQAPSTFNAICSPLLRQ